LENFTAKQYATSPVSSALQADIQYMYSMAFLYIVSQWWDFREPFA
jgi:hypothetical protein